LNFIQFFVKHSNTKFHGNPSSVEQRCSMETEGRTGMTKPTVIFRKSAKQPEMLSSTYILWLVSH